MSSFRRLLSWSTSTRSSRGATTTSRSTTGDPAAWRGQADHGGLPAACRAHGARRPLLRGLRRRPSRAASRRRASGGHVSKLRERGWVKIDLGPGADAARRRQLHTPSGKLGPIAPVAFFDPPAEVADDELAGASRSPYHAEDASVPELHIREPAAPARRAARAVRGHPSARCRSPRHRGRRVRVFNDRGSFACRAGVR